MRTSQRKLRQNWGWDEEKKIEYRRVDHYRTEINIPILTPPFANKDSFTLTYHRPLESYFAALIGAGFVVDGLELANGYFELKDWSEHMERFAIDNQVREARELPTIDIDEKFMTSIRAGLPDCAGVALGFDRLLMLKMGESDIGAVQLF